MAALGTAWKIASTVVSTPFKHPGKTLLAGGLVSAFAFAGAGAAAAPLSQGLATAGTRAVAGTYNIAAQGIPNFFSYLWTNAPGAFESASNFFSGVVDNVKAGIASGPN